MEQLTGVTRVITGGIDRFSFVPVEGIATWPTTFAEIEEADITFNAGFAWLTGAADFNSLTYQQTPALDARGVLLNMQVSGFLPDDLFENTAALLASHNRKYIVRFTTRQGRTRILGTPENPCTFSYGANIPEQGQRKGSSFTFACKGLTPALFVALAEEVFSLSFTITAMGMLEYAGSTTETFTLDADGKLVVSGPDEALYSINATGFLLKA